MKIHFLEANKFVVSDFDEDAIIITAEKPVYELTALAMFVLSLARCTFSVLWVYGSRKDADPDTIEMTMSWDFNHEPIRFKHIDMDILWRSLPDKKLKAAQKMAGHCTVHNTIHNCVEITTNVRTQ